MLGKKGGADQPHLFPGPKGEDDSALKSVRILLPLFGELLCQFQNHGCARSVIIGSRMNLSLPALPEHRAALAMAEVIVMGADQDVFILPFRRGRHNRSEERRVGKECRSRWSPY